MDTAQISEEIKKRKYYMVRAMTSSQDELEVFTKNNVVAVGWSDVNFSENNDDVQAICKAVDSHYYANKGYAPQSVGKWMAQIHRFCGIKKDDYIIVPYGNHIIFAIAQGKELYYSDNERNFGLANQKKVEFQYIGNDLKKIPRDALSEALQRRLRVQGSTVADLSEFSKEIEDLFANRTYKTAFIEGEIKREKEFKAKLLQRISDGDTNLQTGGIGLEKLICELFKHEGYEASILGKQTFPSGADADIKATKSDQFFEMKIFAQIKHHQGISEITGLNQLLKIKSGQEYQDYKFVYITSASDFSPDVKDEADKNDVILMNGEELMTWLFSHIENLSFDIKQTLSISSVPQI